MRARLELAIEIAREVGALQRQWFTEPRTIETKSSAIDLVTDVDRACDVLIRERIASSFPEDGMLTEEDSEHRGTSDWRWVVDPLDGTTNYAHGIPHFAVAIGLELAGESVAGVIYDPIRDELFRAERGSGAWLNESPIRVSEIDMLRSALLATGFAYDVHTVESDNIAFFTRFMRRAQAIRRAGSAALDLAYLAAGRFDGFWELDLHPWDVSAGLVMVKEAGGAATDLDGSSVPATGERLVASNGLLHEEMLRILGRS